MGASHTQAAGLVADNHFILDGGASRSMASQDRFRDHGEWLRSHGRNPRTLEPGGAMFNFGDGNVTKPLGRNRAQICFGRRRVPIAITIFAALAPNIPTCPGLADPGALIDTSRNVLEMSRIGVAGRPFATAWVA